MTLEDGRGITTKLWNEGDDDLHTPDRADVEEAVRNAATFVDAIAALLRSA